LAEGAIKIGKLVDLCEQHKMPAVAVTDSNNLFGAIDLSLKCAEHGIQPIIACQLNVQHTKKINHQTSVLLYAKNRNGYQNLIQLVSNAYLNPTSALYPEVSLDMLAKYSDNLILATGGICGSLGTLLLENDTTGAKEYIEFLKNHYKDRLYVEISRHNNEQENTIEDDMISFAYDFDLPIVATNNVCYSTPDDFDSHDALICIAQGRTIYDQERQTSSPEFYFKSSEEMNKLFSDLPEAIANTANIAHRCSFMLINQKPMLPQFSSDSGKTQDEELKDMATKGLHARLEILKNSEIHQQYFDRLDYELDMIRKMGFSGYFLIIADYVRWAKSQNIPVGPGRGSGAGSIVAWSIHITDVDPIHFKLFFERFLNPDRVSMPDFDIDFCQERRNEVIEYVQQKYGHKCVAQIITFGKLQAKAVVRDIGRVLAMSYGFVDKISKMIPFHPTNPLTLQEAIDLESSLRELTKSDPQVEHLMKIALRLEGLYRHAGVHAAGVVISDKNLHDLVPLYKDPKSTMPVTQFSMKYIENAGLIKFDFLGLKTLTVIQKVLDLIKVRGVKLSTQEIPFDDAKTFKLLKNVNCVGVFQIESGGMRDVLKKLKPDRVEDLIALVALYRPGPMDDIPKYIASKHGIEPITYLHDKLKPILGETYGVMVYQEQVMQIAQEIGGYSLGQADLLRRAMGKKNKEEMQAQEKRFIKGATECGISLDISRRLFEQMNKFAGYGFNKSHSTPYGLLTYQTAFLKANYMLEFFAAVMTLDFINTEKLHIYYLDAKKNGIRIDPPDINLSENDFAVDYASNCIKYSLAALKGSGKFVANEIVKERKANGPYISVFDFAERFSNLKILNRRVWESFIKAGVFDSLHANRRQLYESLDRILSIKPSLDQASLFEKTSPSLADVLEWSESEKQQHEFKAVGFYISSHPLEQYEDIIRKYKFKTIAEANELSKAKVAAVICDISNKVSKNQNRFCVVQISDTSGEAEVSVFPEVLSSCKDILEVGNVILLNLVCYKNEDYVRLTAEKVQKLDQNYSASESAVDAKIPASSIAPKVGARIMQIKISNRNELIAIKKLIDLFKKDGGFLLKLQILDNKKIVLPDKYLLTSYDIMDMRNVVGVNNVIEVIKEIK
jgi:DNA polymerase-3 subunit alpha